MTKINGNSSTVAAALIMLFTLHAIMLLSLYYGVKPHPPRAVTPFAMAPFLAVQLGLISISLYLLSTSRIAIYSSAIAAILSLVSFGPQKYLDPAFPEIWIAVLAAQIAIVTIGFQLFTSSSTKG